MVGSGWATRVNWHNMLQCIFMSFTNLLHYWFFGFVYVRNALHSPFDTHNYHFFLKGYQHICCNFVSCILYPQFWWSLVPVHGSRKATCCPFHKKWQSSVFERSGVLNFSCTCGHSVRHLTPEKDCCLLCFSLLVPSFFFFNVFCFALLFSPSNILLLFF